MAGVNDVTIIGGIVLLFLLIGGFLPYVQAEFDQPITNNDASGLSNVEDAGNPVSAFDALGSMLLMFFWTFGSVPFWLDLVLFTPLRLILVVVVARNIWIGGGG